jgi:hypothetical protein
VIADQMCIARTRQGTCGRLTAELSIDFVVHAS